MLAFGGASAPFRVLLTAALTVVSVSCSGGGHAQPLPTTNYENSGVVSEMIGSNAAGTTAYTSDFVARFTSERAESRINATMARLRNLYHSSKPIASQEPVAQRGNSRLDFLFAGSEAGQEEQGARRARDALDRHGFESEPVRTLVRSLRELLSGQQVDATQFVKAVNAYNQVVEEETDSLLADPPQVLLNIHVVLASLTEAVSATQDAEPPVAHTLGREVASADQLRVHLPKNGDGIEAKAPLVKPGTATATPTAFGALWGQVYGSVAYQPVSRHATRRDPNWKAGRWSDGTISFGAGVGNPHKWVGLDITLNIIETIETVETWSLSEFARERTLSLKLHRALPYESAIALGYENAWRNSPEEREGGNSVYGVATKVFTIRARRNSFFSRATVSVGVGTDRFLPESQYQRSAKGANVFGSVGVRLWPFMNVVADWTGQDLNVGVSVTPIPRIPIVLTPALVDVTGRAGSGMRFSIGAALTYDFRR